MESIRESIANSYLAEGLSSAQLDALVAISSVKEYVDGEEILSQFETDTDLMIMVDGEGTITSYLNEPIGKVKPGQVFGEVAFFDEKRRSASITSAGKSSVILIDGGPLRDLMDRDVDLAVKVQRGVIMVLCGRLRATTKQLAAYIALDDAV